MVSDAGKGGISRRVRKAAASGVALPPIPESTGVKNGRGAGHDEDDKLSRNDAYFSCRRLSTCGWPRLAFLCVFAAVALFVRPHVSNTSGPIGTSDKDGVTQTRGTRASEATVQHQRTEPPANAATVLNYRNSVTRAGREQELRREKRRTKTAKANALENEKASGLRRRQQAWPAEANLESIGIIDGVKSLGKGVRRRDDLSPTEWFSERRHGLDFGGLEISLLDEGERRYIATDSKEGARVTIYYTDDASESFDQYDSMDDDAVRSNLFTKKNDNNECRQPSWFRLHFPTCNSFHEMQLIHADANNRYLGRGFFRMAFLLREEDQPEVVLKAIRWKERGTVFIDDRYEKTRMDALVMERLTSSPRITDMYGHCATSIITESLPVEVWGEAVPVERTIRRKDLHDRDDVDPKNTYSPTEKIYMALNMAEALADLHGFKDGMIAHDDLDLGQYLRAMPGGEIKLNDFNRAKPMLWDDSKQEYCKYYNGKIGGKFRAPEEFVPTILDEKIDIFSLGNCFYGLLTGLWPHYLDDSTPAQKKLLDGKMPYVDKRYRVRSYAEGKLVEAIEMCHHRKPRHRSDVFAIVKHLRVAVEENARRTSRQTPR